MIVLLITYKNVFLCYFTMVARMHSLRTSLDTMILLVSDLAHVRMMCDIQ